MPKSGLRQTLSLPDLLKATRHCFEQVPDTKSGCTIPLADHLMSGVAVFGLKYPSLLQFDQDQNLELIQSNLQSLYGIGQAPCDTLSARATRYGQSPALTQWVIAFWLGHELALRSLTPYLTEIICSNVNAN